MLEPTVCRKYLILVGMSKPAHEADFGVAEADSQILEQIRQVGCFVSLVNLKERSVEGRQTQLSGAYL